MSAGKRTVVVAATIALLAGVTGVIGQTFGAFSSTSSNSGNSFAAASDYRAPTQNRSVIAKSAGGTPGFIKQGGTYFVYADLTDTGNPASGISSVTADSSSVTTGATATALSSGGFTENGVSYSHRTASLTANATLTAGTYTYTVTGTDAAGNSSTSSYSVTVDNTQPSASDIQTTNGGAVAGRPDQGDTITFTFSEPPDPNSILSGWTGSATSVVARVNNGSGSGNDTVTIFNSANTTQLPLGSVNLGRTDYTSANITFGATSTASTMTLSGNSISIVLGTQSAAGTTAAGTGSMIWTPSATATDRAGNASTTTARTETGTVDKDF